MQYLLLILKISSIERGNVKSLNFGGAILGGPPQFGTPKFCQILSFLYIYIIMSLKVYLIHG